MMYEIIFTQGTYILLLLLTIIYFHNQRFNTLRNKVYKGLLITGLIVSTFEIIYIFSLTYMDSNILSYIFYKIYILIELLWWNIYFLYFMITTNTREAKSIIEVIKSKKSIIIWFIYSLIVMISYAFIRFSKMTIYTIDFLHGASSLYITLTAVLVSSILIYQMIKNKSKTTSMEQNAFYIGVLAIAIYFILQYLYRGISFVPSCYALIIYVIYFCAENPDIQVLNEINEAQNDIEQSNQTKTDFLSNMTYEIKTPMNLISELCDELNSMDKFDEKSFREDISQIVSTGKNLLDIVENILDISKIETGKQVLSEKEYKVSDLLTDVLNITKSKLGPKPVKIIFNVDQNISSVLYGDYSKIYQAITNIIANAAKYTEVGRITFTLSSKKDDGIEKLLFKITDTGTGIKDDEKYKIFQKGARLENATIEEIDGTGFGLAITKQYVEILGGNIWFESKYRVGTTFFVELEQKIIDSTPIEKTIQQQNKTESNEKLDCSNIKVLIVDDNLLNIKVAKRILEGYKMTVESVTTGKDCIYKIKEGINYDAIFMDHMMPEMDGIETLHILKKLDGYTLPPIIALTANAVAGMKEMYLSEGFDDYLSKPINLSELDRVINKFFNK